MDVPDYFNRVNPDLLRFIPGDARRVLEFGCGAGALAAAYRRVNPDVDYRGVEMHGAAADIARARLDHVTVGDLEKLGAADIGVEPGTLDAVLYGDVLEHLVDPWAALKKHVEWLSPGGQVLACIPNVQHWSLVAPLLTGKWEYQDQGLLDRTHLRFFSLETMRDLFQSAGLTVDLAQGRGNTSPQHAQVVKLLGPMLGALKLDPKAYAQRSQPIQYIIRGMREAPKRRTFVQTLVMLPLAVARPRVYEPDRFTATVPGVRVRSVRGDKDAGGPATLEGYRSDEEGVVVLQRIILNRDVDQVMLKQLLAHDWLVLAEMDDDPRHNPKFGDMYTFRAVHAVQTSTEPLAEHLRQYNPNVVVFPNRVAELPPPPEPSDPDGPVRAFFGALNREEDWAELMPSINRVLAEFAGRVEVEVVHDQAFFDALTFEHKRFKPFAPFDDYAATLERCDVALLPLRETPFNSMKSDLKFMESAARGTAVLASPTVYKQSVRDGETGLLFETVEDFEQKFRQLLGDRELRDRLRRGAYDWVRRERLMGRHARERVDAYRALRDELPRLRAELAAREPHLVSRPDLPPAS